MKTLSEKIAVMQAAADGKQIEYTMCGGKDWYPVDNADADSWDWGMWNYRVAPEPKRVPLGPEDVPPGSVVRHVGDPKWKWQGVCPEDADGVMIRSSANYMPFRALMGDYEISRDGGKTWQPCWREVVS